VSAGLRAWTFGLLLCMGRSGSEAAAGLEERQWPVGGLEAMDDLERRLGCRDRGPGIVSRGLHL
jgi:hypothetical protein